MRYLRYEDKQYLSQLINLQNVYFIYCTKAISFGHNW